MPCNGLLHSAHIRRPFLVVVVEVEVVVAVESEDVGTGDAGGMVVVRRVVVVVALARAEVGGDWVPAPFTCTGDALFTRDDDDDEWKLKGEDEGEIESGLPEIEERIEPAGDKGGGGGLEAVLSRCNVF